MNEAPFFWIGGGYLAGSIPTGYLLGRWLKGVDIRRAGSGNVGATNVFRTVGTAAGFATLAIDMAKGFLPVAVMNQAGVTHPWPLAAGVAAVIGHTASPWVAFKGGKGVATSAGIFLALLPGPMVYALAAFVAGFGISRRVSVGSLSGAVVLPAAAWADGSPAPLLVLSAVVGVFVIVKHGPNIRRLWRGEEPPVRIFPARKE